MNAIERHLNEQLSKTFFDLIDENVNSDNPNLEWITQLYIDIRDRLLKYLNPESKMYKELSAEFDVELFKQMIENNVFDIDSLVNLISNTFNWVLRLEAPVRNISTREAKTRVLNSKPEKMISTFIREIHISLNQIDEDTETYEYITSMIKTKS